MQMYASGFCITEGPARAQSATALPSASKRPSAPMLVGNVTSAVTEHAYM
jgi:hypothetical protein